MVYKIISYKIFQNAQHIAQNIGYSQQIEKAEDHNR